MTTQSIAPMVLDYDTKGRGEGRVAVPPGRYFLGDPCYAVPDALWMPLLRSSGFFGAVADGEEWGGEPMTGPSGPVGTVETHGKTFTVVAFGTQYGDGCYRDEQGTEYGVDAGLIGLVPVELTCAAGPGDGLNAYSTLPGKMVEFTTGVLAERSADGTLTFGPYVIETGDAADEDEDCPTCGYGPNDCAGGAGYECDTYSDEDEDEG